jgi:hypothetical protein
MKINHIHLYCTFQRTYIELKITHQIFMCKGTLARHSYIFGVGLNTEHPNTTVMTKATHIHTHFVHVQIKTCEISIVTVRFLAFTFIRHELRHILFDLEHTHRSSCQLPSLELLQVLVTISSVLRNNFTTC